MGVSIEYVVGPPTGTVATPAKVKAFLGKLVHQDLVLGPASIYSGFESSELDPEDEDDGFSWLSFMAVDRKSRAAYTGDDLEKALSVFEDIFSERRNAAVTFEAFNNEHPELSVFLDQNDFYNAEVGLVALAESRMIRLVDAVGGEPDTILEFQQFFGCNGKSGPCTLLGSPLESLLKDCFGPKLLEGVGSM